MVPNVKEGRKTTAEKTTSQGAVPLKDSPAVERALSRSKLYLLLSWIYLYPMSFLIIYKAENLLRMEKRPWRVLKEPSKDMAGKRVEKIYG